MTGLEVCLVSPRTKELRAMAYQDIFTRQIEQLSMVLRRLLSGLT